MTAAPDPSVVWVATERVVLRRPCPADLAAYVRLHTDPRTYAHAPDAMPTVDRCRDRLAVDLADWETSKLGYAAVVDRATRAVIGWAGLRHKDSDRGSLNLYYRLAYDRLGSGLGREISRALVAWGVEHRPEAVVTAMVDTVNTASLRTARRAGLVQVGLPVSEDDVDGKPMAYFEAPAVRVLPAAAADCLREALVDLWVRVNDAGGSVGFLPGASAADVAAALDRHLDDVRAERSVPCVLVDPDAAGTDVADPTAARGPAEWWRSDTVPSRLRGLGFWEHSRGFPYEHLAGLKRLMVDPSARGRNLGRILLGGMVGVARRDLPWVELLRLDYRDGLGLGDFYAKSGWTEVGRVPRGLRLSATDYRDDVAMARRIDGSRLR